MFSKIVNFIKNKREKVSKIFSMVIKIGVIFAVIILLYISPDIVRAVSQLYNYKIKTSTQIYDRENRFINFLYKDRHREYVKLDDIPSRLIESFIAIEDTNFFEHNGINTMAIIRAATKNVIKNKIVEGASTITQQLVKNSVLTNEKTFTRKGKEIIIALIIDAILTKNEILELYLNKIYFGKGYYGVKSASQGYFKKDLKDLTLKESVIIAGLPRSPNYYSPVNNYKGSIGRANRVLYRLYILGWINKKEYEDAIKESPKVYNEKINRYANAPYANGYIVKKFKKRIPDLLTGGYKIYTTISLDIQKMQDSAMLTAYNKDIKKIKKDKQSAFDDYSKAIKLKKYFDEDGIFDTEGFGEYVKDQLHIGIKSEDDNVDIDEDINSKEGIDEEDKLAELNKVKKEKLPEKKRAFLYNIKKLVDKNYEDIKSVDDIKNIYISNALKNFNGAAITIKQHSGEIIAYNGGVNFVKSPYDRVTRAHRQIGSSVKPFIYLTALNKGFATNSEISDNSRTFKYKDKSGNTITWKPKNSTDNFTGALTLQNALTHSVNLATIGLVTKIGLKTVVGNLRRYGFEKVPMELSISLGSFESTPFELAHNYTIISNGGVKKELYMVKKIVDKTGKIVYEHKNSDDEVRYEKEKQIYLITSMMRNVMEHGTGRSANVNGIELAGKTGTTNSGVDTWTVAFSQDIQSVVWFGNDDNTPIYQHRNAYGSQIAGPVIRSLFTQIKRYKTDIETKFIIPDGVKTTVIDGENVYYTDISKPSNTKSKKYKDSSMFYQ